MIPPSLVRCPHSPPPACHRSHTQDVPSYANSYTLVQQQAEAMEQEAKDVKDAKDAKDARDTAIRSLD